MKLKPQIYAKLLVDSLDGKTDTKKLAANFWQLLQKNNQYRDLVKILDAVDIEFAKKHGKVIAKVYSEIALSEAELKEIETKVEKKLNKKVLITNILKPNWGGITVEVDDEIIDLSSKGKIEKLKQAISS